MQSVGKSGELKRYTADWRTGVTRTVTKVRVRGLPSRVQPRMRMQRRVDQGAHFSLVPIVLLMIHNTTHTNYALHSA
jgi:hypothetical protein